MTIGESIRYHRKRLGLTQAELADRVGVSAQAVSKWENNVGLPDISMAVPLARALGTTTDELLRFGERYQEFEDLWRTTLQFTRCDPEKLLEVALAALKEFPHDRIFLFRAAIEELTLASKAEDSDVSRDYIGRALANAAYYAEMSPGDQNARSFYKRMLAKCRLSANGDYELREEFRGPNVSDILL